MNTQLADAWPSNVSAVSLGDRVIGSVPVARWLTERVYADEFQRTFGEDSIWIWEIVR